MSLTYTEIEERLLRGIYFSAQRREFVARADPTTGRVTIREMSGFGHTSITLDVVVDRAHANEAGSDLTDVSALERLLGELTIPAL